jgi:hypothetical protein
MSDLFIESAYADEDYDVVYDENQKTSKNATKTTGKT